ncbi:MAG TPA: amino acid permease [Acidimicrobiales bacterium]|nr:amino acid permease [Acidimicrobiales bacterium]
MVEGSDGEPAPARLAPTPSLTRDTASEYPEARSYRLKRFFLGKPLVSEQLSAERLSRPIALGVLAPDCISSSAYGTEQMLTQMTPYIGLAAFSLLVPITFVILGVLLVVTLSYLDVIGYYTSAGGSYVVARDNFGPKVAQIAAVALLIDYSVTVAVQSAAGTDALASAFPRLNGWVLPITIGIVLLLIFGNLRGIREAGRMFALPTYLYVLLLGATMLIGYVKFFGGTLPVIPTPPPDKLYGGTFGAPGSGAIYGLAFISLLRAYANGGSSLTGLEAISNGVASFRRPQGRNARVTLVIMSSILGFLVLSTTLMAKWMHALPRDGGIPTVVSQEVNGIFGATGFGHVLFLLVQFATVAILWTGGNTSFNGFPFLANYVANDGYLPRQLTKRGHRLAFSNGIIVLGIVALALILIFDANVTGLVSLYAIGVFTGFTMAGLGMVAHHRRGHGPHRTRGIIVNAISAVTTFAVVLIFAIAKFTEGAWIVVVLGPLMYFGLIRLHRQYETEDTVLRAKVDDVSGAAALRRNVVYVLIDSYDLAAARALQYARSLNPTELRAIHFDVDPQVTRQLEEAWADVGPRNLTLEVIECPDRRIERAALELAAEAARPVDTECTIVLPRRSFATRLERVLHDRTADDIAEAVTLVPRVSATVIPFRLDVKKRRRFRALAAESKASPVVRGTPVFKADVLLAERSSGATSVCDAAWRERAKFSGRIRSVSVRKVDGAPTLECTLSDGSGSLLLVFQGRSHIPGIELGARMVVEGTVGSWQRKLAIINPDYELVAGPESNT